MLRAAGPGHSLRKIMASVEDSAGYPNELIGRKAT